VRLRAAAGHAQTCGARLRAARHEREPEGRSSTDTWSYCMATSSKQASMELQHQAQCASGCGVLQASGRWRARTRLS
jgi:hypothetical protein